MSKAARLNRAKIAQRTLNKAEKLATHAALERDAAVFDAQAEGATYGEIQTATGLSEARIPQVLRKERERRTS